MIASCQGREITLSCDHLRPSAANFTRVCMTAFASRCVYYFTRWGHGIWRLEWLKLLLACGWWVGGGGTAHRLSRYELTMFNEKILSRNEAWFVMITKQMTTQKKNNNFTTNINYLLNISKSICLGLGLGLGLLLVNLLISLPEFRWQQLVGDDSVRLCM